MSETDPVEAALLNAIGQNDQAELRLALARHLLDQGRPGDALAQYQHVLGLQPANVEAVRGACESATAAGNDELAVGYRRLLDAIDRPPETPVSHDLPTPAPAARPAAPLPPPVHDTTGEPKESTSDGEGDEPIPVSGASPTDEDYDEFLREVLADDRQDRVSLGDIGGLTKVKAELDRRFFGPIRNPEIQKAFGKPINGGLLLYGPPGCGKTYLARAIAGELSARFIPVTLHDTLDMWMGNAERNLHGIFNQARNETPSVIFLDEVDAIGQRRSRVSNSSMRNVVAQLLTELDGAVERNDGVFVIAATNAPWDVDAALRRPGRFDRTILVLPPDEEARVSILSLHLRDRPLAGDINVEPVAAATRGLTGADLKLLCDTAVELAMEQSMKTGSVVPVEQSHLLKALKTASPSVGPWIESARNFVTFSNSDGEYDELERYINSQRKRF